MFSTKISNEDVAEVVPVPATDVTSMGAHSMQSFDGPSPPKLRRSACTDFSKMLDAINAEEPFNLKATKKARVAAKKARTTASTGASKAMKAAPPTTKNKNTKHTQNKKTKHTQNKKKVARTGKLAMTEVRECSHGITSNGTGVTAAPVAEPINSQDFDMCTLCVICVRCVLPPREHVCMCDMCLRHVSPPRELVCVYVSHGHAITHHLVSMLVHMVVHERMYMCFRIYIRTAQDMAVLSVADKKAIHNAASCTYKRKLTELKDAYMLMKEKKTTRKHRCKRGERC